MKPSDDLFQLIKSLTKTEKRYFKRFCKLYSTDKKNNYTKLFDEIDKQKVYDEKLIKNKFKDEKFIKQLNVIKNYLYNLILKSLRIYNEKLSSEIILRESAIEVDILARKRLFNQSKKLLKRTIKAALLEEDFILQLELYRLEKKLLHSFPLKNLIGDVKSVIKKEQETVEEMLDLNTNLFVETQLGFFHEKIWTNADNKGVKENYYNHINEVVKELKCPRNSTTTNIKSRFVYLRTFIKYSEMIDDYKSAYSCSEDLVKLFEKNTHFLSVNVIHYCGVMYNFCWILIKLRKYNEAEKAVIKLSQRLTDKAIRSSIAFYTKLYVGYGELQLLINICTAKINNKFIMEFEQFLLQLKDAENSGRIKTIYLYISINYVLTQNYEKALEWINRINHEISDNIAINTGILCWVISSVIHFELRNYLYLENLVTLSNRFFSKINYFNSTEMRVIVELNKAANELDNRKRLEIFSNLRKELSKHIKMSSKTTLKEFDVIAWLDSKINNKSYMSIIQEKAKLLLG